MKIQQFLAMSVGLLVLSSAVLAQRANPPVRQGTKNWTKSGIAGGNATGTVKSGKGKVSGNSTYTGPNGKSASGSSELNYGRGKTPRPKSHRPERQRGDF